MPRVVLSIELFLAVLLSLAGSVAAAQPAGFTVPATVGSDETFDVSVGEAQDTGGLLRFGDEQGNILGGSYAYVGNARNGVVRLTAPFEPGRYKVLLISAGEVVAQQDIEVAATRATLTAPAKAVINSKVTVTFVGPGFTGDYLQFVDAAGEPVRGLYGYVGNSRGDGLSLKAPATAGDYMIGYFTGTSRQIIGSTGIVIEGAAATMEVPPTVAAGAHFPVRWEGPNNPGDMIQLLADGSVASYAYAGNSVDGTVMLRAPEQPGAYAVIYLTGSATIGETAISVEDVAAELTADEQVTGSTRFSVGWEGPGNRGDRVILVVPGTAEPQTYAYVEPALGNAVNLMAPDEAGGYELQYVTHGGRTLARRPVEVSPAQLVPGSLRVLSGAVIELESDDAVEVVLDASGSMLQRQNGERRIEIARRSLRELVDETIPENTPFALRVFGHREPDKCRTDLELPLAPLDRQLAAARLDAIQAMNLARTPIADSLALTAADLRGVTGERIINLVADGEETCSGSPAEVIASLRDADVNVRVNIVGYAIDDAALRETFSGWAELGGGEYFDAAAVRPIE